MKERFFYNLLVAGVVLWCLLLLSPSILMMTGTAYTPLANVLYNCFSSICHQYDSHSLHLGGYKLAVCSRCTAIYFGSFLGVILFRLFIRKSFSYPLILWLLGGVPMMMDVLLDMSGWHSSTLATRLMTGGWFGIIAAFILTPLFIEAGMQIFYRKRRRVAYESKT